MLTHVTDRARQRALAVHTAGSSFPLPPDFVNVDVSPHLVWLHPWQGLPCLHSLQHVLSLVLVGKRYDVDQRWTWCIKKINLIYWLLNDITIENPSRIYDIVRFIIPVCLGLNPVCKSCWSIGRQQGYTISVCHRTASVTFSMEGSSAAGRQQGSAISVCHRTASVTFSIEGPSAALLFQLIVSMYFEVGLSFASLVDSIRQHAGLPWTEVSRSMSKPAPLSHFDLTARRVQPCSTPYFFVGDYVLPLDVGSVSETTVFKGLSIVY